MSKRKVSIEDFMDILRDGLSSQKSYVILKQKSRSPIFLQFKPIINRLSQSVLYIGGKLSAFPDTNHEKWQARGSEDRVEALQSAWRRLPKDRVGEERVGSHAGIYVVAPTGQLRTFTAKFDSGNLMTKMLSAIESELNVDIENKAEVRNFLKFTYSQQWDALFSQGGAKVEARLVGKKSELMLGQKYEGAYENDALIEFQQHHGVDGVDNIEIEEAA